MSGVGKRATLVLGAMLLAAGGAPVRAQAPEEPLVLPKPATARRFETRPGQFEIVAADSASAQVVLGAAASTWDQLRVVLDLPARYPTPVIVRVIPEAQWTGPAVFNVFVEAGGIVSVRIRWAADLTPVILHRALAQALLMRQAVAWHGLSPGLRAPLWLEHACAAWVMGREQPALVDMWQQEAATVAAPPLATLLGWERGGVESRAGENAAYWLLVFLQAESGGARRWPALLRQLVGPGDPVVLLGSAYRSSFSDAQTRELWWQVGFHHHRRLSALPVEQAAESRAWLADGGRWLAGRAGRDEVLSLEDLWTYRREPWMRAEFDRRLVLITRRLGRVHPFYQNAALAQGRLYEAARDDRLEDFSRARDDFLRDAAAGRELEDFSRARIDELDAKISAARDRAKHSPAGAR